MKKLVWFCVVIWLSGWWALHSPVAIAQTPTCTVNITAPINQYVLPNVNSGSYGQTPSNQFTLTVVGRNESGTWYAIQLLNSNPPTYAWIAAADLDSTDGTCGNVPVVNPNDVGASLAAVGQSASLPPATLPDCTISATQANIRQSPSTQAPIVGELKPGVARAIGRTADSTWFEIELPEGRGWIAQIVSSQSGDCDQLPVTASVVNTANAPCPSGFVGYTPPRVQIGDVAQVLAQSGRVRIEADLGASIVFQIPSGGTFTIIDGPQCNDGIVWWAIDQDGRNGWIAEAEASGTYLIAPVANANTPEPFACDPTNPNYRPTRLRLSDTEVTVNTAIPSLILFTEPDLNAPRITEIAAGTIIPQLNAGPRCHQNAVWWNVTVGELSGWLVESSTNDSNIDYYLIPPERPIDVPAQTPSVESRAFPPSHGRITFDNVDEIAQLGSLALDEARAMAWASNDRYIAVIADNTPQLYRYPSLRPDDALNALLADSPTPTALAFDRDGRYLVVGYEDGSVRLLDIEAEALFELPAHADPISAVAFSIDNTMLLITSGYFYDTPPTEFDFRASVYDFMSLNALDGSLALLFEQTFDVDSPPLAANFSTEGQAVVLSVRRVFVIGAEGIVGEVRRAETILGAQVLPAQSRWFNRLDVVFFGTGPALAALETSTITVQDRPIVLLNPGVVIAAAQTPPNPDHIPMLAAFVDYPEESNLPDSIRFISPEDNSGLFTRYLELEDVLALAFSPDGSLLAVLQPDGIRFYGLP